MIKYLFCSAICLHFTTLHLNNSYNTDVSDNLSVIGEDTMLSHCMLCVAAIVAWVPPTAWACILPQGHSVPPVYSLQHLVHEAPVVLVGRVRSVHQDSQLAWLSVLCVLKWDAGPVPDEVSIQYAAFTPPCSPRLGWLYGRTGHTRLVLLHRDLWSADTFSFYEPNVFNSGDYEASPDHMQKAANVCGVDVHDRACGVFECPVPSVGPETCHTSDSTTESV